MYMKFSADAMLKRVKAEGKEALLDDGVLELIGKLDGKIGSDYNWDSFVYGRDVVWIPGEQLPDEDFDGTYVARCDCKYI